jgi:hypothetical protein
MKTPKNMALSTGFEITKAASWHFGNQPDRQVKSDEPEAFMRRAGGRGHCLQ